MIEDSSTSTSLDALFQLGLCYSVGFGVDKDSTRALHLAELASHKGLLKAQAVFIRLCSALGGDIGSILEPNIAKSWLIQGTLSGSRIASMDLERLYPFEYASCIETIQSQKHQLLETRLGHPDGLDLLLAVRYGSLNLVEHFLEQGMSPAIRGEHGETALHWCTLLQKSVATRLAIRLLEAGADPKIRSTSRCPLSDQEHYMNDMPPYSNAIEWAIINDRSDLLEVFLQAEHIVDSVFRDGLHPLAYAALYQSIRCLRYLCELFPAQVNRFDSSGFSACYYAVRADRLNRLLNFSPEPEGMEDGFKQPPYVSCQVKVLKVIVDAGSNLNVSSHTLFTCLHLAMIDCDIAILKLLLESPFSGRMLKAEAKGLGWTALKDAIAERNEEAFALQIQYGADPATIWPEKQYHALHVCSIYTTNASVNIAKALLAKDLRCVQRVDKDLWTPLHTAAAYENMGMVHLLTNGGAKIDEIVDSGATPLGLAIESRAEFVVRHLCKIHQDRAISPIAWILQTDTDVINRRWLIGRKFNSKPTSGVIVSASIARLRAATSERISALNYLLAPGQRSPDSLASIGHIRTLRRNVVEVGCYDHPFSDPSRRILGILVEHYIPPKCFGIDLSFISYHESDSGIRWAVKTANISAVRTISESSKFRPQWRALIDLAFCQLEIGQKESSPKHFATELEIKEVVACLREYQKEEYEHFRISRLSKGKAKKLLSLVWILYYKAYAGMEQKQFERYSDWRLQKRPNYYPMRHEFQEWWRFKVSYYTIAVSLTIGLVAPMIACLGVVAANSQTQFSTSNIIYVSTTVVLVGEYGNQ